MRVEIGVSLRKQRGWKERETEMAEDMRIAMRMWPIRRAVPSSARFGNWIILPRLRFFIFFLRDVFSLFWTYGI